MGDPSSGPGFALAGSPPAGSTPSVLQPSGPTSTVVVAKQLTAAIKGCTSLERLVQLCSAHQAGLNPIHIAAIITRLPKLDVVQGSPAGFGSAADPAAAGGSWTLPAPSAQQQQLRQLLQQLLARLKLQGCSDHGPRGVANIVWALAKLQCAPDAELWAMLLDRFCQQLGTAVPQDISNLLWGVAKLTKERAPVLSTAPDSTQQQQSQPDSLGPSPAAAGAAGPLLQQEQVRLLLQHLCKQLPSASVQTISNSLWAVVVLQQEYLWCMCNCLADVQTLMGAFCAQPQQALPGHIQPVIRCMAQLASTCSSHAGDAWLQWQPPLLQRLLDYLATEREQLEMHHVSSVLRDVAQIVCLHLQLQKQHREQQQQGPGGSGMATPSGFSSSSSLPSMSEGLGAAAAGLELEPHRRISSGVGGAGAASSTASSSSTLTSSGAVQSVPASTASGEDPEDVLARLAASGGPQDASSTVLALAMLRPQLQQLGLQPGVASLCSLLPPAALPQLGPDVAPRLLAAASLADSSSACSPGAVPQAERAGSGDEASLAGRPALPISSMYAARVFAQSGEGLPLVPVPLAEPGSGSSSSGSSIASPTHPAPLAGFGGASPTAAGLSGATGLGLAAGLLAGPSSNPGHGNPHSNPGSPQRAAANPGSPAAGAAGAAEGDAGDSQEEAAARQLTHNIAYADSVFQLSDIFTAHASVMDMIHITACITRLSKVLGTSPSQASQAQAASLLPLLGNKLLSVLPNANARGIANVLWGYGRLRALPQLQLLAPLVEAFLTQLPNAACRDSAVVLWSLARLSEGHGDPADPTVPAPLLQRLGREVLQQLATAAQDAPPPEAAQRQQQQQQLPQKPPPQQQPGTPGSGAAAAAAGEHGKAEGGAEDPSGPPSSRDVSNSLMALARLGFLPEDDTTPAAAAAGAAQEAGQAAAGVTGQLQGLSLGAGAAVPVQPGSGPGPKLTLPLSLIKAVVDYLLRMAATAKTLDLQETATALKQLGLRELHARVASTVVMQHGATHAGSGGGFGMQFMQFGAPSRGQGRGRGMQQGHFGGGQQYPGGSMLQRRQQGPPGGMYGGGGGWVPAHQVSQGMGVSFDGGAMLRQGGQAGYMGPRQEPARQVVRPPGIMQQQQHPQAAYMLSAVDALPAGGGMQGMAGYGGLAAAGGGVAGVQIGGSPAAGYGLQYAAEQQQQQQAGALYAPGMQYMMVQPQQARAGMGPQGQQQGGGDFGLAGMPVLQQQAAAGGEATPPGLLGASPGQQYYLAAAASQALVISGLGGAEPQASAEQPQLFLQPLQQAQAARAGLGGVGQYGGYQVGSGSLVPDAMTSTAYTPAVVGDIFLSGQQQQPQTQRSQLQMLQQQMGQPVGLYQQQQQQPQQQGYQGQDQAGALYLRQPQQQQQQQQLPVVMYGLAGQQPGTFVLDPTTGMYIQQQ